MQSTVLPYPCVLDVWDTLSRESRPIMVYGMGNGADKLFSRFEKYGITVAEVFASDGFVRGHSFRGYRVKTLSEIRESYPDFVVVLSFASSRPEVLAMLDALDSEVDLYIPDMPVVGDAYFDREFYNENYAQITRAMEALADERSRALFRSVVLYKLTGRLSYLREHLSDKGALYSALAPSGIRTVLDGGAYTGDTFLEALSYFPNLERVILAEPDPKTYRRLLRTLSRTESSVVAEGYNVALGRERATLTFHGSGNRNSSLVGASYEHADTGVSVLPIDELVGDTPVDYIKLDVEGAEADALIGADATIRAHRPRLLISLYHRSEDIFSLILFIKEKYPFYTLSLHRLPCVPAWELDLICIPER